MTTEFLIFGLLIISLTINLLALGAFWVTPGLRTTANRFVINLLIVNIIGCIFLAPTLFLNTSKTVLQEEDIIKIQIKNHQPVNHNNNNNNQKNQTKIIETLVKCNQSYCEKFIIENYENHETIVITEKKDVKNDLNNIDQNDQNVNDNFNDDQNDDRDKSDNNNNNNNNNDDQLNKSNFKNNQILRCWSLDLAAALGSLSVLLVVGDTWCAVTDPLRYHSRISGLKSWILIAIVWFFSILFGILSALRDNIFKTIEIDRTDHFHASTTATTSTITTTTTVDGINDIGSTIATQYYNNITEPILTTTTTTTTAVQLSSDLYNIIFSYIYFIFIILIPFGCVCGMYWRIFSEAKENGLRVRQNGSSPLLQSALNLSTTSTTHNNVQQQQQHHHHTHHQQQQQQQLFIPKDLITTTSTAGNGSSTASMGLTMKIDKHRRNSDRDIMKPLIFPVSILHHRASEQSNSSSLFDEKGEMIKQDRNQNILLTLSTATNEDLRRNYSARQLSLIGESSLSSSPSSSDDDINTSHHDHNEHHHHDHHNKNNKNNTNNNNNKIGIRQVHSTPNLQKSSNELNGFMDRLHHLHYHPDLPHFHHHNHHNALQLPQTIIQASPKALSYMTSIRHRLSNASSLFKYREESRAARISILVVIMFLISYLPYGLIVILQNHYQNLFGQSIIQIAIILILFGNLSSPFIFAYRNKRVRRGVKRLIHLDQRSRNSRKLLFKRKGSNCSGSGTGIKPSINNVKCSGSKVSTYSVNNSCKILAPNNVINKCTVNGTTTTTTATTTKTKGTFPMEIYKCHNHLNNFDNNSKKIVASGPLTSDDCVGDCGINTNIKIKNTINNYCQNGAIIKQIYKDPEKSRSLLKVVCDSSRKLGCATNSCATSDNEQTDV